MSQFSRVLLILSCCTVIGNALECYVCDQQEVNTEKCTSTIRTCEHEEDTCSTEVKWGSTPYWSSAAKKQYYISKKCMTKGKCEEMKKLNMSDCTYLWYQDWQCSECCQGDRCNFYVFSEASKFMPWCIVTLMSIVPIFWSWINA